MTSASMNAKMGAVSVSDDPEPPRHVVEFRIPFVEA